LRRRDGYAAASFGGLADLDLDQPMSALPADSQAKDWKSLAEIEMCPQAPF
jgi:hypothetical protein